MTQEEEVQERKTQEGKKPEGKTQEGKTQVVKTQVERRQAVMTQEGKTGSRKYRNERLRKGRHRKGRHRQGRHRKGEQKNGQHETVRYGHNQRENPCASTVMRTRTTDKEPDCQKLPCMMLLLHMPVWAMSRHPANCRSRTDKNDRSDVVSAVGTGVIC